MGDSGHPVYIADARVETKYKEQSQCRGRRAVLRVRRVFRTRMLVERGDEEVRRKRVQLRRRRTGCPWSIDLPHGTRQSIVPWDSRSLSRRCRSRRSFLVFLHFLFSPLFFKAPPCSAWYTLSWVTKAEWLDRRRKSQRQYGQ